MTNYAEKIKQDNEYTFELIKGNERGNLFFAYALFHVKAFAELKEKMDADEAVRIRDYGIVILKDAGHEPTKEQKEKAIQILENEYLKG